MAGQTDADVINAAVAALLADVTSRDGGREAFRQLPSDVQGIALAAASDHRERMHALDRTAADDDIDEP